MRGLAKPRSELSRQIVKAMGLFGGTQVVSILCGLIRIKLVALWIGAVGVGLFGIFSNAVEMIGTISHLSLRNSSVRDLAGAKSPNALAVLITVVRRWAWGLGMLGALLMMILAPLLSRVSFGDDTHIWGFVFISIAVFFRSICHGEYAILQGKNLLMRLAKASTYCSIFGLLASIPLLRIYGEDGIIPSLICYQLVMFIAMMILRDRDSKPIERITWKQTVTDGRGFVVLGIYMTISMFVTYLMNYVFMAYLNIYSGTESLGYYQAGYTLVTRYVGLVFTAIAVEYYPRMTRSITSYRRTGIIVSHEMSIVLWVLMPFLTIFIAADKIAVQLLYTADFMVILPYITWATVGIVLQGVSWCLAYVIIARGDGHTYLVTEIVSCVIGLALNILGFHFFGYLGLGVSYAVWYICYTAIVWYVYRYRYGLRLGRNMKSLVAFAVCIVSGAVIVRNYLDWWWLAAIVGIGLMFGTYRCIYRR